MHQLNIEEISQEPTQPTRFFKHIEAIGDHQIPTIPLIKKDLKKNITMNNNYLQQPQLPKISRRRVATEVSTNDKQENIKDNASSTNKLGKSRYKDTRNIKSRSSLYSLDTKSKVFEFKSKILKTGSDIEEYTFHLRKLEELYQLLSQLLLGVFQANPNLIKECLRKYMTYMEQLRYEFLDYFILELSPKGQRVLNISRIQQFMSILYIAERVLLRALKPREDALVNMIGFCASNIIFIAKLYILSRRTNTQLPFQLSIRQYERTNFRVQLNNYDDIITRIQHNNETIKITQIRNGKGDLELHNKLKDFIKMASMQRFTPSHSFSYLFEYFAYYLHLNSQLGTLQCLQTSPAPYLPPQKYYLTIVIEPVGVLVCQKKLKMGIRPHSLQLLNYLRQRNCEVVLWTQTMPSAVKQILKLIDPEKQIKHKLYKYHCSINQDNYVKDLRRLGRDMDKTLIIDFSKDSFKFTPNNGIQAPWNKSNRDKSLMDLIQIISFIIKSDSPVELSLSQHKKQLEEFKLKTRSKSLVAHNTK